MPEAQQIGATPGPWGWFGCQHGFYLATKHSGRRYVMDFVRQGMRGAQPRFQIRGIMRDAAELVQFAVGGQSVRGLTAGKAHESVYRYDITAIDHPDARLIAAAPDLLAALKRIVAGREVRDPLDPHGSTRVESLPVDEIECICEAAIALINPPAPVAANG